jgi:hypothetical protein
VARVARPSTYYIYTLSCHIREGIKSLWTYPSYRNVRRRAEERVCAREAKEKRQEDMRAQSRERKQREQRIATGVIVVRQSTLTEFTFTKKRRVIEETDSDEEESGSVNIDDTSGSSSRSVHVVHRVHPDVLHPTWQLQVPASAAAATSAAAAATAAATATTSLVCLGYCCRPICVACPGCAAACCWCCACCRHLSYT